MLGGLYGDLPQAKAKDDSVPSSAAEAWSVHLPPSRKPPAFGGAPSAVLKAATRTKEAASRVVGKPSAGRAGMKTSLDRSRRLPTYGHLAGRDN